VLCDRWWGTEPIAYDFGIPLGQALAFCMRKSTVVSIQYGNVD
jgi:hypothetical protein